MIKSLAHYKTSSGRGPRGGKGRDLLHVVDLIVLPFLVPCDLALRLLRQLAQVFLRVLLHGILHCLGQC